MTINVIFPSSGSPQQHTILIESNRQRSCDLVKQVRLKRGHCTAIVARFVSELLQRDGQLAKWQQDDGELLPAIRLPMRLTVPMYTWPEIQLGARFDFDERWALAYLPEGLRGQWRGATASPLLAKISPETYRFLNREVFGFLVAMTSFKGYFGRSNETTSDTTRHR